MWEIPTMKAATKLDHRRRGTFPSNFQPGDLFIQEMIDAEAVTFKLVRPSEVPLVVARKVRGHLMGAKITLDTSALAATMRAERDSR